MPKWTQAPLSLGAYSDDSHAFSDQDIVNLLVCPAEKQGTRTRVPLRSIPGQQEFAWLGNVRRQRGAYVAEGRLFVVGDTELSQILPSGSVAHRGTVPGTSRISAAHNKITNGNEVKFVTGSWGGIYDTTTETLTQITDEAYPGEKQTRFIGSLFIGVEHNGRYVVVSDLANGLSYNALEIFDGESSPDRIMAAEPSHGEVVMFNERTIEHFAYTGTTNELFQNKIVTVELGLAATHAVNSLDNRLFFVGSDGSPYYLNGYTPVRIGTHALEQAWAKCDLSKCYSFPWEDRGWKLWIVTFPDGGTWAYDIAASAQLGEPVWVRFKSYGMDRWRPAWLVKWNGDWYSGEHNSGRVFRLSWSYFLEGSDTMERRVRSGILHDNANRVSLNALRAEVDCAGAETVATAVLHIRILDIDGNVPDGLTGTEIDYRYTVIGGQGERTLVVLSGSLPPGLAMDTTGHVTGTLTTAGSYSWVVQATDTAGQTDSLTDTCVVTGELYLTGDPPDSTIGEAYSYSGFAAHEGTAPYVSWAITSGTLPPGLAINAGTGAITGTPTTAGAYAFTVTVTDTATDTASLAVDVEIASNVLSFNLHGRTNAGSSSAVGYTITVPSAGNTVDVTLVADTYTAWSAWSSDASPQAAGLPWLCLYNVTDSGGTTAFNSTHYTSAALALAAATPHTLTGFTSYTFWLPDSANADNRGGLSFTYIVS